MSSGEEAVDIQRQRIVELAGDAKAGARNQLACGSTVQALEMSDFGGTLALTSPSC
jgi:hypothetical protein